MMAYNRYIDGGSHFCLLSCKPQNASAFVKRRLRLMFDMNQHLLEAQELDDWELRYLFGFLDIFAILYIGKGSSMGAFIIQMSGASRRDTHRCTPIFSKLLIQFWTHLYKDAFAFSLI